MAIILNGAYSTVQAGSSAIGSSSATGITVASGEGAQFGTISTSQYIPAVITRIVSGQEVISEYVWITARSTDTLTVTRQAEDSTRFPASTTSIQAGDSIAAVATVGTLNALPLGVLAGDGSDGDVTVSSGTTTLARDMYYRNLTVASGATLKSAGFRVYVHNILTNNGTIHCDGAAPAGAVGSSGITGNTPLARSGTSGGAGATGAGGAATAVTDSIGASGGAGGTGVSGGGAAATATAPVAARGGLHGFPNITGFISGFQGSLVTNLLIGGASGSGGGGDGTNRGGHGGGGGGVLFLIASSITGTGAIRARGGAGENGTGGNSGGGGGGGGGGVIVISGSVAAGTVAGQTIDANGGTGGTGAGTGTAGGNGSAGTLVLLGP